MIMIILEGLKGNILSLISNVWKDLIWKGLKSRLLEIEEIEILEGILRVDLEGIILDEDVNFIFLNFLPFFD